MVASGPVYPASDGAAVALGDAAAAVAAAEGGGAALALGHRGRGAAARGRQERDHRAEDDEGAGSAGRMALPAVHDSSSFSRSR